MLTMKSGDTHMELLKHKESRLSIEIDHDHDKMNQACEEYVGFLN